MRRTHTLATKLGAIGAVLMVMAMASIGLTFWSPGSWKVVPPR